MSIAVDLIMLAGGFLLLVKGADWFVEGASDVARKFHVPALVIGLTVVAMGTSLPEAAISISASWKGSAGIAIGNVLGSNIMNIGLILGITALITPLIVQRTTRRYELPMVLFATCVLAVMGMSANEVSRFEGLVLLGFFVLYLIYTMKMAVKQSGDKIDPPEEEDDSDKKTQPIAKIIAMIIIGGACITFGANLTVDGASALARLFGISEKVIGLTIVAFGTSLPELVTCIVAAIRKEADIAVGNIIGSNIFNILFVVGMAAAIKPVGYESSFLTDSIACAIMPILLWVLVQNREKHLKRWGGAVLLAAYIAYFILYNVGIAN